MRKEQMIKSGTEEGTRLEKEALIKGFVQHEIKPHVKKNERRKGGLAHSLH